MYAYADSFDRAIGQSDGSTVGILCAKKPMICTKESVRSRPREGEFSMRTELYWQIMKTVCTISVIHSQIKEPEKVIAMLTKELGIEEAEARKTGE